MPRRRKGNQSVESEAAETIEGWDALDEASKRRIRNRLSQRYFRERKSMYIKNLEKASKASSQTESRRNQALAKELADLRSAALKIRTQILKLSCSLNSVGAEVGRILEMNVLEDSDSVEPDAIRSTSATSDQASEVIVAGDLNEDPSTEESAAPTEEQHCRDFGLDGALSSDCLEANYPENAADILQRPAAASPCSTSRPLEKDIRSFANYRGNSIVPGMCSPTSAAHYANQGTSQAFTAAFVSESNAKTTPAPYNDIPGLNGTHFDGGTFHGDMPLPPDQIANQRAFQPMHQHNINTLMNSTPTQTNLGLPQGHFPTLYGGHFQQNYPPSTFAMHIETLELQIRRRVDAAPNKSTRQMLIRSCSAIMALFVQNAWPPTQSVWFKSQVPEIIGPILLWRINPSYDTHNLLGADYKPTELQLSVPHSAVIDWIPYSGLRDRVIMYYNHSVVVDRLLCDMMNSYVIEVADLSKVLPQAPPGRAYFGIWNLFCAIDMAFEKKPSNPSNDHTSWSEFAGIPIDELGKEMENPFSTYNEFVLGSQSIQSPEADDGNPNQESGPSSKSFNLVDILKTPAAVLKLSHDIRLYASRSWRFDRTLFDKYPELKFEGYENIVARGRSCRIPTAAPDAPKEMTQQMMQLYQNVLEGIV